MENYPAQLPPPVRDGFSSSKKQSMPTTQMDDGRPRLKRRYSVQPKTFVVTWHFTWDDLSLFEAFVEYDLGGGAEWFMLPIFHDEAPLKVRMVAGEQGQYSVNFLSDGDWEVKAELEYIVSAPVVPSATGILPNWISDFPEPEQSNYGYNYNNSVIRSKIETGLAEQRRRFKERVTMYRFVWICTPAQKNQIEDYVKNTLIDGFSWFNAPFVNGMGVATVRARFVSPLVVSPLGGAYNVSANLMTLNPPIMSEETYDSIIAGTVIGQSWDSGVLWDGNTPWV